MAAARSGRGAQGVALRRARCARPICPLPVVTDAAARLAERPASDLRVTWLGHSTVLVEIDGAAVLTDPMWGERASPSRWAGPKPVPRRRRSPIAALPPHRRRRRLARALRPPRRGIDPRAGGARRAVPRAARHRRAPGGLGHPAAQIVEHDWWQEATLAPAACAWWRRRRATSTAAACPGARARSGARGRSSAPATASSSAATPASRSRCARSRAGWGRSTSRCSRSASTTRPGATSTSARKGRWKPTRASAPRCCIPIHWSTFVLAYHDWSEPAETLFRLAEARGVRLVTPRLGEPIEPAAEPAPRTTAWWRALPPIAAKCP